jgi:hypothetical protein
MVLSPSLPDWKSCELEETIGIDPQTLSPTLQGDAGTSIGCIVRYPTHVLCPSSRIAPATLTRLKPPILTLVLEGAIFGSYLLTAMQLSSSTLCIRMNLGKHITLISF